VIPFSRHQILPPGTSIILVSSCSIDFLHFLDLPYKSERMVLRFRFKIRRRANFEAAPARCPTSCNFVGGPGGGAGWHQPIRTEIFDQIQEHALGQIEAETRAARKIGSYFACVDRAPWKDD
jgi:hypothetical protein